MSIEAMTWALSVPVGGNAKVILLGLANHAHVDGTEAYPSLDTLAVYAHCDRSTARRNLRKLVDAGWIAADGTGPKGQGKYRLATHIAVGRHPAPSSSPSLRICVYCGGDADVMDHVVPRSRGGGIEKNMAPACGPCNASKGARDLHEWVTATGRDWSAIETRLKPWVTGWQNATHAQDSGVAERTEGGGIGYPPQVAPVQPEPSLGTILEGVGSAREESPLAQTLSEIVAILRQCPRLHVDQIGVENAVAMWPGRDAIRAARTVVTWASDPAFRTTNAAKLLGDALSKQTPEAVSARDEKKARDARRLASLHSLAGGTS